MRSKIVWLIPAACILAASAGCFSAAGTATRLNGDANSCPAPVAPTAEHRLLASRIKFIQLYCVHQGKAEKLVLTQSDLRATSYLEIDGYVSGIVALCENEMVISIDGRRMSSIRIGRDGAFWLKNVGKLSEANLLPAAGSPYYGLRRSEAGRVEQQRSILAGGYSFFPPVFGDAVSPESRFKIHFDADGEKMDFIVQQTGYTSLSVVAPEPPLGRQPIPFYYAGKPAAEYNRMPGDIKARIGAIAKGIGAVETSLCGNLVEGVTIIDAENRYNAVTSQGLRRIWFYSDTFLTEPLGELSVIAEHESLHILVDLLQLTEHTEIRELFADLKGYDDFSRERFELVTTGRTRSRPGTDQSKHALFFAFISENHFLKGMKGGHPQSDPEEFCTSFLHSLMYIERFGDALSEPLVTAHAAPRLLSVKEKSEVVKDYLRTIEVFAKILADRGPQAGSPGTKAAEYLSSRLVQARTALHRGLM